MDILYVIVCQRYLLSSTQFNVFLEKTIKDALEDHESSVVFSSKTIIKLLFADGIDGIAGSEDELSSLVQHLDKATSEWSMQISAKKIS